MRKKANAQRVIEATIRELKLYMPERIILFGSRARGDYKHNSDIDIAVDLVLDFRGKRKLLEKIDKLSGLYTVDIVFLPEIDENFRKKILEEGKVLYEKK